MSSQTVVETPSTETLLGRESEEPAPRYPPSKERSLTDLLRREYELATSARPIHPPDTAAKIAQGFPAPAPFWVGLRPFILLMPFTGVGPAVFLMSHGSAAYICCAALLYAYLAFSGYRMGRGDLALAFGRTSSDVHSYAGSPNVIQYLMLMIWLPVWFTSLSCIFSSAIVPKPLLAVAAFWGVLFIKNGVCMSVVLHRYASHAAFKVGPATSLLLGCLGCFAYQGALPCLALPCPALTCTSGLHPSCLARTLRALSARPGAPRHAHAASTDASTPRPQAARSGGGRATARTTSTATRRRATRTRRRSWA